MSTRRKGNDRYPYEPIRRYVLAREKRESMSERDIGILCGVSERRIRAARMEGEVDEYIVDVMCCSLGIHPSELFDDWITPLSLFAGDIREGKISKEDAADRGGAYLAICEDA